MVGNETLAVGPSCGISSERGGYGPGTLRVPWRSSSRRDLIRLMCDFNVFMFWGLKLAIFFPSQGSFMVLPDFLSFHAQDELRSVLVGVGQW